MAHVYPVPSFVLHRRNAEMTRKRHPMSGLAVLSRALSAGVKPKPTRINGSCCDVLLGSSLKNI
jgi:hypothetical protein